MDTNTPIPYEQAQKLAQMISNQYNIKNYKDWEKLVNGSEKDFFIIEPTRSGKSFLAFELARKYVKSLKIDSAHKFRIYCEENDIADIPSHPAKHYKNHHFYHT